MIPLKFSPQPEVLPLNSLATVVSSCESHFQAAVFFMYALHLLSFKLSSCLCHAQLIFLKSCTVEKYFD
jgi:hypothetical protein